MLRDFPTGAGRMIWEQEGYLATIVNGAGDHRRRQRHPGDPREVIRFNQ